MIWTNIRPAVNRLAAPAVNTLEDSDAYTLELALPGWQKEHVSLSVDGDLLIVRGELPKPAEGEQTPAYRRREFGLNEFEKSFHLPDTIDVEAINATLDYGILRIALPKVPEVKPVRKAIEIG